MATYDIVCDGPGPHDPPSGIVGTSSVQNAKGMRCKAAACVPPVDPAVANRQTNEDGLRASLADMQAIIDGASTTREKQYARAIRRLLKAQLSDFATAT